MCIEVECGGKWANTVAGLAEMIGMGVLWHDGTECDKPGSCLCNIDWDGTLERAGFEEVYSKYMGRDPYEAHIRAKGGCGETSL